MSPLEVIDNEIWRNTGQANGIENIMAMANASVATLGDKGYDFSTTLLESLDPHSEKGSRFGVDNALLLESIGSLITDAEAVKVTRWGALALIGALALGYNASLHENIKTVDRSVYQAQTASFMARNILSDFVERGKLTEVTDSGIEYFNFARSILGHPSRTTQDIALDLEMYGLGNYYPENHYGYTPYKALDAMTKDTSKNALKDTHEENIQGCAISEPSAIDITPYLAKIENLGCIDVAKLTEVEARYVKHDGQDTAIIIDITSGNGTLTELKNKLLRSKLSDLFWDQLAGNVLRFSEGCRMPVLRDTDVAILYMKNKGRRNENIMRAYYTPLGNSDEGLAVVGLVAAIHTKKDQAKVIGMLGGNQSNMSEK